jgi:class 3 adenylate cyclase
VLFSDIQGFTQIAEEMNPEVLIDELDKFFFHFDSVVEKYRIEKIKTIGDAYMCAGGIPEKNRTNPVEVILQPSRCSTYEQAQRNFPLGGMKYWDVRIGIGRKL